MSAKVIKAPLHKRKRILAADIKIENAASAKKIVLAKKAKLSTPPSSINIKESLLNVVDTTDSNNIYSNEIMSSPLRQKKIITIRLLVLG